MTKLEFNIYTVNPAIDGVVGWWLPGAYGYTKRRSEAGRFSLEDALRYARDCGQDEPQIMMVQVCEHPGGYFEIVSEQEEDGVIRLKRGDYKHP